MLLWVTMGHKLWPRPGPYLFFTCCAAIPPVSMHASEHAPVRRSLAFDDRKLWFVHRVLQGIQHPNECIDVKVIHTIAFSSTPLLSARQVSNNEEQGR